MKFEHLEDNLISVSYLNKIIGTSTINNTLYQIFEMLNKLKCYMKRSDIPEEKILYSEIIESLRSVINEELLYSRG